MPPAAPAPRRRKRARLLPSCLGLSLRLSSVMAAALVLGASAPSCLAFGRRAATMAPLAAARVAAGSTSTSTGPRAAFAFTTPALHLQHQQQHRALSSSSSRTAGGGGFGLLARLRTALASSLQEEEVDPGVVEGTDLRVVKYPDPRLRAANAEVAPEEFGPELQKLAKDMFKVMYAANGVGLAAPQVGVNKRLMVFNPDGDKLKWLSEMVLVNPRIVEKSGKTDVMEEGCLSFPGMAGDVERSLTIKVSFQDAKGKAKTKKFRDWEARIFQHEYDHLDGVVYIDRLSPEGREKVQPVLDKLIADFGPGGAL